LKTIDIIRTDMINSKLAAKYNNSSIIKRNI